MPRLRTEVCPAEAVGESLATRMFALFSRYYDGVTRALFDADLGGKSHVLLLRDESGALRGFSSLLRGTTMYLGAEYQVVFSGDTVIDHRFWGEQALPESWLELVGRFKAERPAVPLLWFLIVKGHRTYRYLSLYAHHYYPTPREDTPGAVRALLDHLATERFGDHYSKATGLIRFPDSKGHLADDYADVSDAAAQRPEVRHFLALNPGYASGDELACLTELSLDNLRPRARAHFARGMAT